MSASKSIDWRRSTDHSAPNSRRGTDYSAPNSRRGTDYSAPNSRKSTDHSARNSRKSTAGTLKTSINKPPVLNKNPPKAQRTEKVEYQTKDITVTLPVVVSGVQKSSLEVDDDDEVSEDEERLATVPAKEVTKITTVEEISPSSVQTVAVTKLEPTITVNQFLDKEITEIRTPIKKHTTTTTTVKKTTLVTTETTTIIGPGSTDTREQ